MAGDYVSCQTRILDELNRAGDATTLAWAKLEILSAIKHYERQRFWFTEGTETVTTTAAVASVAIPSDVLAIDRAQVTYSSRFYPLNPLVGGWDEYIRLSGNDTAAGRGPPSWYVWYANALYFIPVPDNTYTVTLWYLKQLTALSADADTNSWMTDGEELIRNRARAAVNVNYIKDEVAMAEAGRLIGTPYISDMEMIAHQSLRNTSTSRVTTGRVRPTSF